MENGIAIDMNACDVDNSKETLLQIQQLVELSEASRDNQAAVNVGRGECGGCPFAQSITHSQVIHNSSALAPPLLMGLPPSMHVTSEARQLGCPALTCMRPHTHKLRCMQPCLRRL